MEAACVVESVDVVVAEEPGFGVGDGAGAF
jgi:hypothetical protein